MSSRNLHQIHKPTPLAPRHLPLYPQPLRQKQKAKGQLIVKQLQSTIDNLRHQNEQLRYRLAKIELEHANCINEIHDKYAQKQAKRKEKSRLVKGRKDGEKDENLSVEEEFRDIQGLIDRIRWVVNCNGENEIREVGNARSRSNSGERSTSRSKSKQRNRSNPHKGHQQKSFNIYNSIKQQSPYNQTTTNSTDPHKLTQPQLGRKLYTFETVKKIIQAYQSQKSQTFEEQKTKLHLLKQSYDDQISELVSASRLNEQKLIAQAQSKYKDYLRYIENLKEEQCQKLRNLAEQKKTEKEEIKAKLREELKTKVEKECAEEMDRNCKRHESLIKELKENNEVSKLEQRSQIDTIIAEKERQILELEKVAREEKSKSQKRLKNLTEKQNVIMKQDSIIISLKTEIENKCKELRQKEQITKQQTQQFQKYKKEITDRMVKKIKKENQISQQKNQQLQQKYQKQLTKCHQKIKQLEGTSKKQLFTSQQCSQQELEKLRKQVHRRQAAHQQSLLNLTNLKQKQLKDTRSIYQKKVSELNRRITDLQKEFIEKHKPVNDNGRINYRKSETEEQLGWELKIERQKRGRLEAQVKRLKEKYQEITEEGQREMLDIESIVEQMKGTTQGYEYDIAKLNEELDAVKAELKAERNKSELLDEQCKQSQDYLNRLKVLGERKEPCGHYQQIQTLKQENNIKVKQIQIEMEKKLTQISSKQKVQKRYLCQKISMLEKQLSTKQSQIQRQRIQFQTNFNKLFKMDLSSPNPLSPNKMNSKQNSLTNSRGDKIDVQILLLRVKELQTSNLNYSEKVRVLEQSNAVLRRQICNQMDGSNKEKEFYETVNSLRAKLSSSEKREKLLRENSLNMGKNRSSSNNNSNRNTNTDRNVNLNSRSGRERASLNRSKQYQNCNKIIYNEILDNKKLIGRRQNEFQMATVKAQRNYFKGVDKYTSEFDSPIEQASNSNSNNGSK